MDRLAIHQQITFIMVRDLEATADFYERLLGLSLAVDQGTCRIYRVVGDAYLGFCERPEEVDSTRNVILTLVTPEVDDWYEQLVGRGVHFEKPPAVNSTYNIYHCLTRDPDGYLVEIQRFLDPVMARLPQNASAPEVASVHYRALVEGDHQLWRATLRERYQQSADVRGSTPHTWWNAGRRMVEHNVYYEFERVANSTETEQKLFFKRFNSDGSQRGRPVPIQLFLENGEWRVKIASY
jgi:catechol 2,3-dioxygenase-like lactoylglutathione lyase family enzyme